MNPEKFKSVKFVLSAIAGFSAAQVVNDIIRNNVVRNSIQVRITTIVIGDIVFEYVRSNVDNKLDRIYAWVIREDEEDLLH